MQFVCLDYATVKRFNGTGMMLLVIGIAGFILAAWQYLDLGKRISVQETRIAKVRAQITKAIPDHANELHDDARVARELKQVNLAMRQLSLPWKGLFEAIDATGTKNVAILAIEPVVEKGLVSISAETNKLDNMMDYVSRLQRIKFFREVLILNHQVQEQDPQKPVRFVVQAVWGMQP